MISKIISGGQTGVDRAALDAAIDMGFPYGGYCPRGRKAEDGIIPSKYTDMIEASTASYKERTKMNVVESDFTIIICESSLTPGCSLTKKLCIDNCRVFEVVFAKKFASASGFRGAMQYENSVKDLIYAIMFARNPDHDLVLNVAGTRASQWYGGYDFTYHLIRAIIREVI